MNPEDVAAGRFKEIRQARERIRKTEALRAQSLARLEELRGQIGSATARDREALGQALVDGKAAPESEAAKLKAELEQAERNDEALLERLQAAYGEIGQLVRDNREPWRAQTLRERAKAESRYEDAITELDAARAALSDESTLLNWLTNGDTAEAALDALGGPRTIFDSESRPVMAFSRVLSELRRDLEYLAEHPGTAAPDPRRKLEPRHELASFWRSG